VVVHVPISATYYHAEEHVIRVKAHFAIWRERAID
jgi:hypothetical protein